MSFKQGHPKRVTESVEGPAADRPRTKGAAQPVQAGLNRPEAGLARCRGCVARLELGLGGSGEQALRDLWRAYVMPAALERRLDVL